MQILVNDEPYAMIGPAAQTVGELANEVCLAASQDQVRFVVGLRCNGQLVDQQELASVLASPASQYDRVELQTQPLAALVRSTLEQAVGVMDDSTCAREKAADLLAAGQQEAAMQELQSFLEAWKQIHQTLMVLSRVLHINLDGLAVDGISLTDVLETLKTQFTELRSAMTQGDFVVVGDILRYELAEPLSHLTACFREIADRT